MLQIESLAPRSDTIYDTECMKKFPGQAKKSRASGADMWLPSSQLTPLPCPARQGRRVGGTASDASVIEEIDDLYAYYIGSASRLSLTRFSFLAGARRSQPVSRGRHCRLMARLANVLSLRRQTRSAARRVPDSCVCSSFGAWPSSLRVRVAWTGRRQRTANEFTIRRHDVRQMSR